MVGALLAANLLLAAGLVARALAPRPVKIVPAARAEALLFPGVVPEEALKEFALRYVLHFDNYTPATIEDATRALQKMISARSWNGAAQALEKRRQVALEGRMSSHVVPLRVAAEGLRVAVEAVRRTFISDRLSREVRVRYEVTLERQPPTEANPFGLGVVAQEIHEL
ncbi:MAG: TraE/TraK family type IV conjugative transfer system protein [Planctomycetota bacterium]